MGIGLANTSQKSSLWPDALFNDVLDRVGDPGVCGGTGVLAGVPQALLVLE